MEQLTPAEVTRLGWASNVFSGPTTPSSPSPTFPSVPALTHAYHLHYDRHQLISSRQMGRLTYYQKMVYTDIELGRRIALRQGEIVQLDMDSPQFARIEGIFSHRADRLEESSARVFLIVTWLQEKKKTAQWVWGLGKARALEEDTTPDRNDCGRIVGLNSLTSLSPVHVHQNFTEHRYIVINETTIALV